MEAFDLAYILAALMIATISLITTGAVIAGLEGAHGVYESKQLVAKTLAFQLILYSAASFAACCYFLFKSMS